MTQEQTITVEVPGPLRPTCGGAARVAVPARTLQGLLDALERLYPELHRSICHETGKVRPHINLFVNMQHMRDREGLDTALGPGDVVIILPAVSGG
ncbi:MAG TPA: MoaD/ThiS family protein [Candidatus Polarisedimenticolia bacterium]|nr:MoaD/ThiS family protein [Candidatus Polarisedimenticolia bacterium]